MIKKLTPEQEAKLEDYYKEGIAIALNDDPVTEEVCRPFIDEIYHEIGLKPPQIILHKSPYHAVQWIKEQEHSGFNNYTNLEGNHSAAWVMFRLFFLRECDVDFGEDTKIFLAYYNLIQHCGWMYLFENVAVLCQRPTVKYYEAGDNIRLHCVNGPAVYFRDTDVHEKCNVWALNDVIVPHELVETPAEQLDPQMILKEKNIEVRREMLRKIGMERMLKHTKHKVLDMETVEIEGHKHDYELLEIDLGERIDPCPCLKMEHASLPGVFLMEFVSRACKTVKDALKFRNGTDSMPEQLS